MQDRQLYQQILGIVSPWVVERVELKLEDGDVHVHLTHPPDASWMCPECGRQCPLHDHQGIRTWRHLDTCQYQTLLHATLPRTNCPEHGVRLVSVSWAEPGSHFTALFERLAIDWLQEASQQAVARQLDLSWDEIHGIMERTVRRGLARRTNCPTWEWMKRRFAAVTATRRLSWTSGAAACCTYPRAATKPASTRSGRH